MVTTKATRDVEVRCPVCGREFYALYEEGDEAFLVSCPSCGETGVTTPEGGDEWCPYQEVQ
jgi:ribosomal protein S27E